VTFFDVPLSGFSTKLSRLTAAHPNKDQHRLLRGAVEVELLSKRANRAWKGKSLDEKEPGGRMDVAG
jgi:hypothetical protein